MSQTATLYRISKETFRSLQEAEREGPVAFPEDIKEDQEFQGSFMALEFLLSKDTDMVSAALVRQIFNPDTTLGDPGIGDPSAEELEQLFEHYESGQWIPYLDPERIAAIGSLLDAVTEQLIDARYDAAALNREGIYPGIWHNDNNPGKAFNKRHVLEDLAMLKAFFTDAASDGDYILVFIG